MSLEKPPLFMSLQSFKNNIFFSFYFKFLTQEDYIRLVEDFFARFCWQRLWSCQARPDMLSLYYSKLVRPNDWQLEEGEEGLKKQPPHVRRGSNDALLNPGLLWSLSLLISIPHFSLFFIMCFSLSSSPSLFSLCLFLYLCLESDTYKL